MAYTDVKKALDEIAESINAVNTRYESAKSIIEGGASALGNIPTKYASELAEIDGYTGDDAAELLAKSEKEKLTADFIALKTKIDSLIATQDWSQ